MRLWEEEILKYGARHVLEDRLKFHGGLDLQTIKDQTGLSAQVIRKHMGKISAATEEKPDLWRWTE